MSDCTVLKTCCILVVGVNIQACSWLCMCVCVCANPWICVYSQQVLGVDGVNFSVHVENQTQVRDTMSRRHHRVYQLYSRTSGKHVQVLGRRISARGEDGDKYGKTHTHRGVQGGSNTQINNLIRVCECNTDKDSDLHTCTLIPSKDCKYKDLKVDQVHAWTDTECSCAGTLTKAHTHASPGFGRGAVELVLGVQRPHRLAADSMIHKRAKEREWERKKVLVKKKGAS